MRGRKPKPTVQKLLEGNPGKRAINREEPRPPAPTTLDVPPPDLADNPEATTEWIRLAPMLARARQITEADRAALIAVCIEWARYRAADRHVARSGLLIQTKSGYPMINPYLSICQRSLNACGKLWSELGLTPSSRSRVKTDGPAPGGDEWSEFDLDPAPVPLDLDDGTRH